VEVTRGCIVVLAAKGASVGKPRPAVVVQSDAFNATHASITVCPITSDCVDAPLFRVALPPGDRTGLVVASQVMVDKVRSVPRSAVDRAIGGCDGLHLEQIDEALRRWLDLQLDSRGPRHECTDYSAVRRRCSLVSSRMSRFHLTPSGLEEPRSA